MYKVVKKLSVLLIAVTAVALTSCDINNAEITDYSNSLFNQIKEGNYQQAYQQTAEEFKQNTTLSQFQSFITEYKLNEFSRVDWLVESINTNKEGKEVVIVNGLLEINANIKSVNLYLVKNENKWRAAYVQMNNPPLPSEEELTTLVNDTMNELVKGIMQDDIEHFYDNYLSMHLKSTATVADIEAAVTAGKSPDEYTPLIKPVNLQITKSKILESGMLAVSGDYADDGDILSFTLLYSKQASAWKLEGIELK